MHSRAFRFGLPLAAAAGFVLVSALAPGCSGSGSSPAAKPNCSHDTDCSNGDKCVNGKCTSVQPACGASGQTCCSGNVCNANLTCTSGTCQPGTSNCGAASQPCCANSSCNTGLSCVGGACKTVGGQMGSPCTKNGDCPSGLCVAITKDLNVCTIGCKTTAECVPGWNCASAGAGATTLVCKCTPAHEICDNLDNDCDGVVDNKPDGECIYALTSERANGIAVDATNVYYTTFNSAGGTGDRGVRKVPIAGGDPTTLALTPEPLYDVPRAIAIDAQNAYWTSDTAAGYIMKVPLSGGTATTLSTKEDSPKDIAVDSKNVYWTNSYQFDGCCSAGTVKSVPLGGGTVTELMSQKTYTSPEGIALDANYVYFADTNIGQLWKIALGGGAPIMMGKGSGSVGAIAVDASGIYFSASGTVQKLSLDAVDGGGTGTTIAPGMAVSLAIDEANVYWAEFPATAPLTGVIKKAPLGGGTAVTLATGQGWPDCVTVDGTNVYWTGSDEAGPGHVFKRVK